VKRAEHPPLLLLRDGAASASLINQRLLRGVRGLSNACKRGLLPSLQPGIISLTWAWG